MSVIYLRHPVHGAKVATMELEAVYDEKNGWERFDPANLNAEPKRAEVHHGGSIANLRAEYHAKFGKKPFGGWDADTLKAKLA